jgi:four helix bundle protein
MFIAYEVSLDLIRSLRDLVPTIKKFDRDLADQIHRAATSVTLNLGEGARNTAGNQRTRFESAHGSANEVKAALQVAASWGWIEDAKPQFEILDRLLALLWRLTHGKGRTTQSGSKAR